MGSLDVLRKSLAEVEEELSLMDEDTKTLKQKAREISTAIKKFERLEEEAKKILKLDGDSVANIL